MTQIQNRRRLSTEITDNIETKLIGYRGDLTKVQEILTLKGHPGWEQLLESAKERIEGIDQKLDKFESLDERHLVIELKERKDFRWLINCINAAERQLPQLINAINLLEREVDERNEQAKPNS